MTSRNRRPIAAVAVSLLGSTTGLLLPLAQPAAAASPTFDRTLVGPSSAAMYPSGAEWDDINDRLVVADTAGDQILIYSSAGEQLDAWGSFGTGPGQFASPRDIAVDGLGNVYVADAENNRVQVLDPSGSFVREWGGIGSCPTCMNTPIGLTWDAANDVLLVASTGQSLIKAFTDTGARVWQSPASATTEINAPRDVARGPDGRIWVSDYRDHQIRAFDVTPEGDWTTPAAIVLGVDVPGATGSGEFNFPYNIEWSPDGTRMYVSDTGNGRISEFDVSGPAPVFLRQLGGRCSAHPQPCPDPPAAPGTFNHLRRVIVDEAGLIYGADFWGNGFEIFDPISGEPVGHIEGASAPLPGVSEAFAVDVANDGTAYVMDRNNHRIERFAADGTFVNAAGGRGTQPGVFSWPESLAVAPDGSVWAADTRGDRIQRFPADLATTPTVPRWGSGGTGVGEFNYIEGIDVGPDGRVWVADTRNDRLQVFDPATETFTVVGAGLLDEPRGVAATGDAVFVADTFNNRVVKLSHTGTELASFNGLNAPEGVDVAPDGTVWVAETGDNQVHHLSADLTDLGESFGGPGAGDLEFDAPHDVAVTGTSLYVADTYNDRVQVFDLGSSGGPDSQPPTGSLVSPAPGATDVPAPVVITGTTADNVGVSSVDVALRNSTTGYWLRPDGTWASGFAWVPATVDAPGASATTWTFTLDPAVPGTRYGFVARAADSAGNATTFQTYTTFTVAHSGTPDTQPPSGTLTAPTPGATDVPAPVLMAGTATDDVAVATVDVAIQDSTTSFWLRPDGTWASGFAWVPASLADAGTTATDWSFTLAPTAPGRRYNFMARTADSAGNRTTFQGFSNFTVAETVPDSEAPAGMVTEPAPGAAVAAPVSISGTASDNVGVSSVDVAIRDTIQGVWLQQDGSWATDFAWLPTSLALPGEPETSFSFLFDPPAAQTWGLMARARDGAGNASVIRPWSTFTSTDEEPPVFEPVPVGELSEPGGVADMYPAGGDGDSAGNLYLADSGGSQLLRIDAGGALSVFSTAGWNDPRDIEVLSDGTMWVADTSDSQVVHVASDGTILAELGGPTRFTTPYGIAADDSGLFVADTYQHEVERIDPTTGDQMWVQATCDGEEFSRPRDVGLGSDGNLYVADTDNDRIAVLDPTDGTCLLDFGTRGTGDGQFRSPRAVTSDGDGGIWVADAFNFRVQHFSNTGTFLGKDPGGYGNGEGQYRSPHCVFVDGAGLLNVCDTFGFRINRFTVTGGVPTFHSVVGGTPPAAGGFNGAFGVGYGPDGSLYAVDWFNHRIQKFDATGQFVLEFGGYGSQPGSLIFPRAVVVNAAGDLVVTNSENNRIDVFTSDGDFLRSIKPPPGSGFSRPHQTALAGDGTYWVADTNNNRVVQIDESGTVLRSWDGSGNLRSPQGIAVEADGNVLVANTNRNRIERYAPDGTLLGTVLDAGTAPNQVTRPAGLLLTGTGSTTRLWIADSGNDRVSVVRTDGTLLGTFGSSGPGVGQLDDPRGVAVRADGVIAVADFANNRISLWNED